MRAIILAAGLSTRLLPLTNNLPKCLLKIGDKTIIEHQVECLYRYNIKEIIVVIGYYGEKIRKVLKDRVSYIENMEYANTNSSYSLWLARDYINEGFIHMSSDLFFHHKILEKLINSNYENAMTIDTSKKYDEDMFKVHLQSSRILKLDKKMNINIANAVGIGPIKFSKFGASAIFKKINNHLKKGDKNIWCYSIFNEISSEVEIYGVDVKDLPWCEVDTAEDLSLAQDLYKTF